MNDNTKVIVALLAGMAAGAALGLLFAPESGDETRDKGDSCKRNRQPCWFKRQGS